MLFFASFLAGVLVKYNIMLVHIFSARTWPIIASRNIVIVVVAICFILPLLRLRPARLALLLTSLLISVAFMANLWYNRYFGNFLSISEMTTGEGYDPTAVVLRHIMRPTDLLFLMDLLIMGLTVGRRKNPAIRPHRYREFRRLTRTSTRVIALLSVALIVATQIFVGNLRRGGLTPAELYRESSAGFVAVYGLAPLYAAEFFIDHRADPQPETLVREQSQPPPMPATRALDGEALVAADTNVVVIQVESLDKKLIDYRYLGREVTPFVNSLKQDSLYADNFYAQHVNGSFDADFSLLTGLYPVNRHYSFRENDMTRFDSLVAILNDAGYRTIALHGNDAEFFYRHRAYPELGFDRFYARPDFSQSRKRFHVEDAYLGINDWDFLYQSLDYIEQAEQPFFAYLITVTSHTPFSFYPPQFAQPQFEQLNSALVRDFFNSIYFVDQALQMFFGELEQRGLAENTLLVIYSDHEAAIDTAEYSSSIGFTIDRNLKQPEHIPLLISHPDIEPGIIEKAGSITDLAPTILDILGFAEVPESFSGSSLLQPGYKPVLFIHELPQILYRDQLYVAELGELEEVGYVEGRQAAIEIPPDKQRRALDTIRYLRELMLVTRRNGG